ncbi:MAG TPA: hypothetical protein VGF61_03030, partial [Candidatus Acidoferrum sp.]
ESPTRGVGILERTQPFLVAVSRPVQALKLHSRRLQDYHDPSLPTDGGKAVKATKQRNAKMNV